MAEAREHDPCRIQRSHPAIGFTKGPGQADEYDQIQGVQSVTNRFKSDELVALVAGCHLLVSIDSGPVHLAGAAGTPVVGLFGV